jgi:beta-galactosidase
MEGAEIPLFQDEAWRGVDLPHDWSIENLPGQEPGKVVGPFSRESIATTANGYTVGGTGWYRKAFTLDPKEKFTRTVIAFDGVYMNSEVWLNGEQLGIHPYGYTAFHYDISPYLHASGTPNTIAVKVKNEGKNSRWYSGSGIYRHVWLFRSQSISIAQNGVSIRTENANENQAAVKITAALEKNIPQTAHVKLLITLVGPDGKIVHACETSEKAMVSTVDAVRLDIDIRDPLLWSVEEPRLYMAEIKVIADGIESDETKIAFVIRAINFSAQKGFLLNGKGFLLKGGCMHHDNGFLGSATIDRAEERRVQLMKAYGFNAIRASHNPPSEQFLDACDRNGLLVIDEAFDMWERPKNPEDYHLFFREWWKKDLESMVHRDRNHPSVIMWSIGNEINERADPLGFDIRKKLV